MIVAGVGLCLLVLTASGLVSARRVRGDSANYLVAGRSLSAGLVGAVLVSQAVDSNATLGNADLAAAFGWWAGAALPIGLALCLLLMGLAPWAPLFWLLSVGEGVFVVVWNVIAVSLRQRLIPDRLLGRVNSVYRFFGWGTISIGTVLGGVLVSWTEPSLGRDWALRGVFVLAGLGHLVAPVYAGGRIGSEQIRAAEALGLERTQCERGHG